MVSFCLVVERGAVAKHRGTRRVRILHFSSAIKCRLSVRADGVDSCDIAGFSLTGLGGMDIHKRLFAAEWKL